jgi:putative transcriptional regulator
MKKGGNLNNRIAELRKDRRMTQEDLAAAVRVTRQTIISLENGRYNASLELAFKIAKLFGTSIESIFLYTEENHADQ